MEFLSPEVFSALFAIVVIDLVLAGDNAIVIALAARNVPKHLQKRAILWGAAGAIVVRTAMTLIVVWLLKIPGLLFVGGALLVWIAYRLLLPEDENGNGAGINAASTFWGALKTIVVADMVTHRRGKQSRGHRRNGAALALRSHRHEHRAQELAHPDARSLGHQPGARADDGAGRDDRGGRGVEAGALRYPGRHWRSAGIAAARSRRLTHRVHPSGADRILGDTDRRRSGICSYAQPVGLTA